MKKSLFKNISLTFLLLVIPYYLSAQCAMCRAALQTGDQESTAEGINHGITYLMAFPYLIAGVIGYAVYRIYRKENKNIES